jgi:hypothetical protein
MVDEEPGPYVGRYKRWLRFDACSPLCVARCADFTYDHRDAPRQLAPATS